MTDKIPAPPLCLYTSAQPWIPNPIYKYPWLALFNFLIPVALIGYGTDPDEGDYWLIKNSWGDMWGDGFMDGAGGFIKLKR